MELIKKNKNKKSDTTFEDRLLMTRKTNENILSLSMF